MAGGLRIECGQETVRGEAGVAEGGVDFGYAAADSGFEQVLAGTSPV